MLKAESYSIKREPTVDSTELLFSANCAYTHVGKIRRCIIKLKSVDFLIEKRIKSQHY